MHTQFPLLAALSAISVAAAAPAQAQSVGTAGFTASRGAEHGVMVHRDDSWRHRGPDDRRWDRRWRRGYNARGVVVHYGGEWARWNNPSFEPEGYNDWWHEREDRSLPRWVQKRECRQQYWTSAGWSC